MIMLLKNRWRSMYFIAWLGFIVLVHQSVLAELIGSGNASWLRRNNEAYVLAALVPMFWELFALTVDPRSPTAELTERRPMWRRSVFVWFLVMILATITLQTETIFGALGLPNTITTYGEAFFATAVITAYLAWSRGLFRPTFTGAPVVGPWARASFYATIALLTMLLHQAFFAERFGSSFVDWWTLNAEAYGAMLLVPLWFDVVAGKPWPKSGYWTLAWMAMLITVPYVVSSQIFGDHGVADSATMQFIRWVGRTTEAFIAALVVGLYFAVWRNLPRPPGSKRATITPMP
ncbi:MAG: hypothetical protein ACI81L_002804 [Verrucomicrobiales bacterium]|jgi:hypothetical protein